MKYFVMRTALAFLLCGAFLAPTAAHAACTSPAGVAGDQIYSNNHNVMQFCNGTSWINMGASVTSTSLSALSDVDTTGAANGNCLVYNNTSSKWEDGSCGAGGDNLGNHTATTNIQLGTHYLSGDGGNEGVTVNSSGYVGVGTNAPSAEGVLSVKGTASAGIMSHNTTGGVLIGYGNGNTIQGRGANGISNTDLFLNVYGGNTGIGTTSPQSLLHVANTGYAQFSKVFAGAPTAADCDNALEAGRVTYDTTGNAWYVCEGATGWVNASSGGAGDNLGNHTATTNIQLGTNWLSGDGGAEGVYVNSSGLVGIGTNNLTYPLHVATTAASSYAAIQTTNGTPVAAGVRFADGTSTSSILVWDFAASQLQFYAGGGAAGDKKMTIGADGRIGIGGQTTVDDRLHVAGGQIRVDNDTNTTNKGCIRYDGTGNKIQFSHDCTTFSDMGGGGAADNLGNHTATTNVQLGANWLSGDGGAEGLRVDSSGNVSIGIATPVSIFDVRAGAHSPSQSFGINLGTPAVATGWLSGIYLRSTGAGVPRLSLDAPSNGTFGTAEIISLSQSGNVGIGETAPADKLHVIGNIRVDNDANTTNKGCIRYDGTGNKIQFSHDCTTFTDMGGGAGDNLGNHTATGTFYLSGNPLWDVSSLYLRDTNGNDGKWAGINVADDILNFQRRTLSTGAFEATLASLNLTTGALTATSFAGSGASLTALNATNLGSGTVPTARLGSGTANSTTFLRGDNTWAAVAGDNLGNHTATQALNMDSFTITNAATIYSNNGVGFTAKNSGGVNENWMIPRWTNDWMYTNYAANGWIIRDNASTEKMRINAAGQLGIGKAPSTALDVNGTVTATAFVGGGAGLTGVPGDDLGAGGTTTGAVYSSNGSGYGYVGGQAGATGSYIRFDGTPAASAGRIYTNLLGTWEYVTHPDYFGPYTTNVNDLGTSAVRWSDGWFAGNVTAAAYLHTSDERLKKEITTIEDPMRVINGLRGVRYKWKEDDTPAYGVIAQEVEKVMPDAVSTDAEGIKAVEYDQIIAPLIEAVKAQQKEIEGLKAEVKALKNVQGK